MTIGASPQFALITELRHEGCSWTEIARRLHYADNQSVAHTYRRMLEVRGLRRKAREEAA